MDGPVVVMTLQKVDLKGSDCFEDLHQMRTDNLGQSWDGPSAIPSFYRRPFQEDLVITVCDFTPKWHAASRTLLGTGHTVIYRPDGQRVSLVRKTAYAGYRMETGQWSEWKCLEMPDEPHFRNAGAGSTQRVDLPDGNILLPIYFNANPSGSRLGASTVLRCRFDGETLEYLEHGSELIPEGETMSGEPSLVSYEGRYYLTVRGRQAGYVAESTDGLHFPGLKPWRWDDGEILESLNTQQHWIVGGGRLYLAYTRKSGDNAHVYCHRAPLFMAEVDPRRLCLLRSSERILMPDRGARYGNFAVTEIDNNEAWVTDCEWMQNDYPYVQAAIDRLQGKVAPEVLQEALRSPRYSELCHLMGADGSVWVTKLRWQRDTLSEIGEGGTR